MDYHKNSRFLSRKLKMLLYEKFYLIVSHQKKCHTKNILEQRKMES